MSNPITVRSHRTAIKWLALVSGLAVLLSFVLPPTTSAAPPPPPLGAEKCAKCHEPETDAWQNSPHAIAIGEGDQLRATCEGCHGPYVKGHPKAGLMKLTVDSSVCADCHSSTFGQWEGSIHAQAGVQCIGCHRSHSQELRLTDEALCGSCHRDRLNDFSHTTHGMAGVSCTDCHMSSAATHAISTLVSNGEPGNKKMAPGHSFEAVSAENCINCHGQSVAISPDNCVNCHGQFVHGDKSLQTSVNPMADMQPLAKPDCPPELETKLELAQQTNKSLQTIAPVSLGLGMGIGGMLGIIFVMAVGYINQRAEQK
jgi:formate-dependent nitrite reductase cytochrome c552 subunit